MSTRARTYQIRVAGHLGDHWSAWLDGFTLTPGDDGTTVITGRIADQAQLHGLLARVRDIGIPLLSLTGLPFDVRALTVPPVRCGGGVMSTIEIAVPSSWTPGETLAVRALLQQSVTAGFPIVAAVRPDATADQIEDIYARLRLLLRERGLAV